MNKPAICLLLILVCVISAAAQPRRKAQPSTRNKANTEKRAPADVDLMAIPPPPPASKPVPEEVVRVETNLVTTPVSVMDRSGRFVPGLTKKDFRILEDGVPQQITYFQSTEQPFTVLLMIDTSPSTRYHIDEIHYAAVTFVNQLRPTDKVMVIAFDGRIKILTEPTTEKQTIFAAIYKSQFGSGTSLYDAVSYVTSLDLVNVPGRKAVVIFTDGVDTTSRAATYESTVSDVEEVDALFYPIRYNTQQSNNASVSQMTGAYGVQLPAGVLAQLSRGQSDAEYQRGKTFLETLATNSGGRIFEADTTTNLETAFAGVAEELRRQYSIGYYASEEGKPGDRKRIKIQVARLPKAIVRAKTTYVVKQKDEPTADVTSPSSTAN